ncbi:MAG: hypothetical protein F6K22_14805 [Okeania sp. SIO2F4]|nr:hypothetical protein [Okeania sp. SIO2F4]
MRTNSPIHLVKHFNFDFLPRLIWRFGISHLTSGVADVGKKCQCGI